MSDRAPPISRSRSAPSQMTQARPPSSAPTTWRPPNARRSRLGVASKALRSDARSTWVWKPGALRNRRWTGDLFEHEVRVVRGVEPTEKPAAAGGELWLVPESGVALLLHARLAAVARGEESAVAFTQVDRPPLLRATVEVSDAAARDEE